MRKPLHDTAARALVLTLGFKNTEGGGWILITPAKKSVKLGDKLK